MCSYISLLYRSISVIHQGFMYMNLADIIMFIHVHICFIIQLMKIIFMPLYFKIMMNTRYILFTFKNNNNIIGSSTLYERMILRTCWYILAEGFRIVNSLFPWCVSIEMGSHILNLQLQLCLGALLGAFESHVLQKVCYSICFFCFKSTA